MLGIKITNLTDIIQLILIVFHSRLNVRHFVCHHGVVVLCSVTVDRDRLLIIE